MVGGAAAIAEGNRLHPLCAPLPTRTLVRTSPFMWPTCQLPSNDLAFDDDLVMISGQPLALPNSELTAFRCRPLKAVFSRHNRSRRQTTGTLNAGARVMRDPRAFVKRTCLWLWRAYILTSTAAAYKALRAARIWAQFPALPNDLCLAIRSFRFRVGQFHMR